MEYPMKYHISTLPQLSHALKDVRKTQGISQETAGKNVGLLPKTISALENHPGSATLDSLLKLLSSLNLEMVISPRNENEDTNVPNAHEDW